jgi:transposase
MAREQIYTETTYGGSKECPGCGAPMDPVAATFAGSTGKCSDCRNRGHAKNLKAAMAKPR